MGAVTDRATEIAGQLTEGGVAATTDIRKVKLPGALVVPVPDRDYTEGTLGGGYTATWTIYALTNGPGDLRAAEELETVVDKVVALVDIETAEATAYKVPGSTDPLPGYKLTTHEII